MLQILYANRLMVCITLLMVTFSAHSSAAEVFKWTDERGQIHYGDKPSNNTSSSQVTIKPPPKTNTELRSKRQEQQKKFLNALEQERLAREEARAKKQQRQAQLEQAEQTCHRLRNNLLDYQRGGFNFYKLDKTGKRHYLTEAEVQEDITALKQRIQADCS